MMAAMTREHEPGHALPGGGRRCVICGAPMDTQYTYSCLPRSTAIPRPRPASGVDDAATISARLAELQAERDALAAKPPEG